MAYSSRLDVEYFFFSSLSFYEKNATSLPSCLRTTPIAKLLASVSIMNTLLKSGSTKIEY